VRLLSQSTPWSISQNVTDRSDKIIFAELKNSTLRMLQDKLLYSVNSIIHQYVSISSHIIDPTPYFVIKRRLSLTLYYLLDYQTHQEHYILDALAKLLNRFDLTEEKHQAVAINLTIAPKLAFFGDKQDEIVVLVDDPQKLLSRLNNSIKLAAHTAHEIHKKMTNTEDLFDLQKSEHYPYVPHISLGRIDFGALESKHSSIIDLIKTRIEQEVFPVIELWLSSKDIGLHLEDFCLYDIVQKLCIKHYDLFCNIENHYGDKLIEIYKK